MTAHAAQDSGLFDGGFDAGTILLFAGMIVALAIVSGLGFIARLRDRSIEREAARARTVDTGGPVDGGQR